MNWESFEFHYRLELGGVDVFSRMISIEAYREAALNLVLPPDWREQLDKLNRVRAVYGTTALEGNPLSEAEVSQQMSLLDQGGVDVEKKASREQRQILNAALAQQWTKERFQPRSAPISLSDILTMHQMVTEQSDIHNNVPGKLRKLNVTVGSDDMGGVHRGAPHEQLDRLMKEYVACVNSRKLMAEHPVIRALLAHFFLVTIHPFGDGNGRVSRLVEAGMLYQSGYNVYGFYGLSNYFYRNEREYKTLLQKSRGQNPFDVTTFIVFGLEGFASELKGINNFIKAKLNRVVYRAMLVRAFNQRMGPRRRLVNQREHNLLSFLLTETEPIDPFSENPSRKIRLDDLQESPYIRATYGSVSRRTFYRELFRLGGNGFIKFQPADPPGNAIVELDFGANGRY